MTIDMFTNERHTTEYADTLTREQCRHAMNEMARQFAELLAHSPAENLYWMESKTDLMDLSHEVYLSEKLVDGQGRPYSFGRLVQRACAVLHVPLPANPYSMAFNARNRKGVKQTSLFSRYCWLMFTKKSSHPLNGMVRRMKDNDIS